MIALKKFSEVELNNIFEEIEKKATETATIEKELREDFFNKLEKDIEELKEKSNNNYILNYNEIRLPYSQDKFYNERKEQLILNSLQKYFYDNISSNYVVNNFVQCFLNQYNHIEIKNNKVKFNINILNKWEELDTRNIYHFFRYFNTITNINIPEWDYKFYNTFNEFNTKYSLNDKIDFKIYKNGKIEVYIK